MIVDTWRWRKKRNSKVKIANQAEEEDSERVSQEQTNDITFMEIVTGAGEGERKIGKRLNLQSDVYTVLFCSLIKTEYREIYNNSHEENQCNPADFGGDRSR